MRTRDLFSFVFLASGVILLAGCATSGVRYADKVVYGDPQSVYNGESRDTSKGNAKDTHRCADDFQTDLGKTRTCLRLVALVYSDTALNDVDAAEYWNFGFTALASAAVGTAIFHAPTDALKALGLAGGTLAGFNAIHSPGALAQTYGNAAVALRCVVDVSRHVPDTWQDNLRNINKAKSDGDTELSKAMDYTAKNKPDPNIVDLNTAIEAYKQAQKLHASVIDFLSDVPGSLADELEVVRSRIVQKLTQATVTMADQEATIAKYVSAAQGAASANVAKAGAASIPTSKMGLKKSDEALEYAQQLKNYTEAIVDNGQIYTDIQSGLTTCIAKMPI